jgi:hypothetical protein
VARAEAMQEVNPKPRWLGSSSCLPLSIPMPTLYRPVYN